MLNSTGDFNQPPEHTSRLKRLGHAYQTISTLIVSTILISIIVFVILDFLFPAEDIFWTATHYRPYSMSFNKDAYYFIKGGDIDRVVSEYDKLAISGHWQVNPWTGLINRYFNGQFLNIDRNGVRRTISPSAGYSGKPPLIIWAFGGSTMFGWGLPDQYTLPSQLQVKLQSRIPERQVRCVNFGTPWFNSSHEAALFIANLRTQKEQPHIAIFLDGYNDLSHIVYYNNEAPLFNELNAAWEARISSFKASPPWITLSPNFPIYRLVRRLGFRRFDPAQEKKEGLHEGKAERLKVAISRYRFNRRMIKVIGQEFGVATYFLLQPMPYWTDKNRVTITQPDYRAFHENLIRNNDNDLFFDITGVLATLDPHYYPTVDHSHYSDIATSIIASRIADLILKTYRLK
jgi:hypothetical protein